MLMNETRHLLINEVRQEWRQLYSLSSILLYVGAAIFIVYLIFNTVLPKTWNTLFWLIMIFSAIQAVSKSFINRESKQQLYYYTIVSPQAIILSKMLYNSALIIILMVISYFGFILVLGNPIVNQLLFIIAVGLGSISFACLLSLIAAIASKATNKNTLMAILGFPLLIPILLLTVNLTNKAIIGMSVADGAKDILLLFTIGAIIISIGYLLFPYLWQD